MRRRTGLGVFWTCFGVLGLVACNQIVGVEDVRLRGTGGRPDPTGTGDAATNPDPDPDPTRPVSEAGADTGGAGCNGNVSCTRHVFLTSQTFSGKMGGLAGADALCYQAAQASQSSPQLKGRVFRAWLSDATKNAADRIPAGTQAFVRGDSVTFAQSFRDMTDGMVANPLNVDEQGNSLTGTGFALSVWTATSAAGIYNGTGCNNWTTDLVTANGAFGDSQATDGDWTEEIGDPIALGSCNSMKHLYCIEY